LNVRGMGSAGIGAKAANIVPSEAVAEIDMRTTPTTDGRKLFELIKRHIEQQGYRLVDAMPSDEERATHDKLASFRLGSVQAAAGTPMDAAVGKWALAALKSPTAPNPAREPVQIRMMGGTVRPTCWSMRCACRSCWSRPSTATTTSMRTTRTCASATSSPARRLSTVCSRRHEAG
jgi:hypothetical protein